MNGALFLPLVVVLGLLSAGRSAWAHHSPGHGPSESLRVLGAWGRSPLPRQRGLALLEVARTSNEPNLNAATTVTLAPLVDLSLSPRWFVSARLPFGVVHEDSGNRSKGGLFDLRLGLSWLVRTPSSARKSHWSLGMNVSLPTRTVVFEADPGRIGGLSVGPRYAYHRGRLVLYAMTLAVAERRPAGEAWEVSSAAGASVRASRTVSLSGGSSVDVRLLSTCRSPSGATVCPQGRASEADRPHGALRVYGNAAASWDFASAWTFFGNAQLPLTRRRDVAWLVSAGFERRF